MVSAAETLGKCSVQSKNIVIDHKEGQQKEREKLRLIPRLLAGEAEE